MVSPVFAMNHQKLLSIFRQVQSCPTAPFHEYHVRDRIEQLLAPCRHVHLEFDACGNLLATYRHGRGPVQWVMGAHMDHPGFVRDPGSGEWKFLGGVPRAFLETGFPRQEFGDFAMWDLPAFEFLDGRLQGRVCDDLVGCAAIVCLFHELERLEVPGPVAAVFTRAEEVGFLGAIELGRAWPFDPGAVFLSLETSAPVPGTAIGAGPVVRTGDAATVFDPATCSLLRRLARERRLPVQRALLDRGSCEATALQHYGIRSGGLSVLLGNYHNCGSDGTIRSEFVDLKDVKALVKLLVALAATEDGVADSWKILEERFEERRKNHVCFWEASREWFS